MLPDQVLEEDKIISRLELLARGLCGASVGVTLLGSGDVGGAELMWRSILLEGSRI
jgi:hypothetical protein